MLQCFLLASTGTLVYCSPAATPTHNMQSTHVGPSRLPRGALGGRHEYADGRAAGCARSHSVLYL